MTPGSASPRSILRLRDDDPPVYLRVIPPFSPGWVDRMESFGAAPARDEFKGHVRSIERTDRWDHAWAITGTMEEQARGAGCAGIVLMGIKYETVVNEAAYRWRT